VLHVELVELVELVDGADLAVLLGAHPVKRGQLERFLFAGWSSI
jgi:hypothetical protein